MSKAPLSTSDQHFDEERIKDMWKELEEHKRQQETIRKMVGAIGGTSSFGDRMVNLIFLLLVLATFAFGLFTEGFFKTLSLEIGLLLISLKIAYFLHNDAKVHHFQFWILSGIEWQTNNLERRFRELDEKMDVLLEKCKSPNGPR